MVTEHFELSEHPFAATPDPRFFYLGSTHRACLDALVGGPRLHTGVLLLTAAHGMGKTSLIVHYLQCLRADPQIAFLFQTAGTSLDLARYLLADLGLRAGNDPGEANKLLNHELSARAEAGQRFILVIDNAHALDKDSFPLRFSAAEERWMELVQIVIAGCPQLGKYFEAFSAASRGRISSRISLAGFTPKETSDYIDHRLRVAGYAGPRLFTPDAQLLIAMHSKGIPRHINTLCSNSMSVAYTMGAKQVNSEMVREVAQALAIGVGTPEEPPCPVSACSRIFVPLGPNSPVILRNKARHLIRRLAFLAAASIFATLSLAAGAYWRTETYFPPTGGQPTVGPSVSSVPNSPVAPAPVAIISSTVPSPTAASLLPVSAKPKDGPPAAASDAAPAGEFVTVVVEPHATLRHLSLEYVGRFDSNVLAEIRRLNPSLTDPNQIEAGGKISLPLDVGRAASDAEADNAVTAPDDSRKEKP